MAGHDAGTFRQSSPRINVWKGGLGIAAWNPWERTQEPERTTTPRARRDVAQHCRSTASELQRCRTAILNLLEVHEQQKANGSNRYGTPVDPGGTPEVYARHSLVGTRPANPLGRPRARCRPPTWPSSLVAGRNTYNSVHNSSHVAYMFPCSVPFTP